MVKRKPTRATGKTKSKGSEEVPAGTTGANTGGDGHTAQGSGDVLRASLDPAYAFLSGSHVQERSVA